MSMSSTLEALQDRLLEEISGAAKSGETAQIPRLSRLLEQTNRDLASARLIERRIGETEAALEATPLNSIAKASNGRSSATIENKKARGNRIRSEFAGRLGLQRVRGVEYRDSAERRVGIATATEDPRGGRWWLGLPNVEFDVVVLICERAAEQLEFIVPRTALADSWKKLSRDVEGREIKFNIRANRDHFELLITGDQPVVITAFLGQTLYLNGNR